jgi:hypothetical protein
MSELEKKLKTASAIFCGALSTAEIIYGSHKILEKCNIHYYEMIYALPMTIAVSAGMLAGFGVFSLISGSEKKKDN